MGMHNARVHNMACRLLQCVGLRAVAFRSNHFDVLADLLRDVVRREKALVLLSVRKAAEAASHEPRYFQDALRDYDSDDDDDFVPPQDNPSDMDEAASMFRVALGKQVALDDVCFHLPTVALDDLQPLPFSVPVPFADRLGVFLADGAEMPAGAYPRPDENVVTVFPVAHIEATATSLPFRVHARSAYRGKPKYSFAELRTKDGELWYCCVWLLFECAYLGRTFRVALVSWLSRRSGAPFATNKATFTWTSKHLDCVEVGHFTRTVVMVRSYSKRCGSEAVFHLLE